MALTGIYGAVERRVALATLYKALDLGVRLFDTAALYADGLNEELLGETLAARDDVFVVTKFGLVTNSTGDLVRDSSPDAIRASVEASLKRLRRHRIDLLLQHRPDPNTPDDDVAHVAAELVREGKIAAFGLSGTTSERAERMGAKVAVTALQNELSLAVPDQISEAINVGRVGAMFMAHSPLGRGILTGRLERVSASGDLRSTMPQFQSKMAAANSHRLRAIHEVAARHAESRPAIALAWVLDIGENVIAMPGARTPEQIEAAASAASIVLTHDDTASFNTANEQSVVAECG